MQLDTSHCEPLEPYTKDASIYPLGENAVVLDAGIETGNHQVQQRIWQLTQQLREQYQQYPSMLDIVPGMYNLTLIFDPLNASELPTDHRVLPELRAYHFWSHRLTQCWQSVCNTPSPSNTGKLFEIPVIYGGEYGPDIDYVAEHNGLTVEQLISAHTAAEYTVYFVGFQPGFAYLQGMNPLLATPRRASPRLAVPAGSVAIGGQQTGIYPLNSPGGWQLIGRYITTAKQAALFDIKQSPPSLLQAGDRLRFVRHD
jgi:KipI family sensor histidine kinase inhibitor